MELYLSLLIVEPVAIQDGFVIWAVIILNSYNDCIFFLILYSLYDLSCVIVPAIMKEADFYTWKLSRQQQYF